MFWANVLCGLLAPVLVVYLLLVGNSRRIMGADRLGWLTNSWLVLTVLVMAAAAGLLFYHLFTA
jgi:Mn2+/Fe2+ NRAMP family transporter